MPNQTAERTAYRRRLGVNLQRLRKRLTPYTQETIADAFGIDRESYGRWERGTQEPKAYDLFRLSERYGIPVEWLVFPTDSVTELDQRIAQLRAAASEAARSETEEGPGQSGADGTGPRLGKPKA